jgi:IS605 OrfB family transposase
MSIITIHCRLTAPEPIRRQLWYLMAERNTPLICELIKRVSQHSDFALWQRRGSIPKKAVMDLCTPLREIYPGQPGRFYASAISMVLYTYESWLTIQQNGRRRLDGKQRWLDVVKSDRELLELSGSSLDVIKQRAQDVLNAINAAQSTQSAPNEKKSKKANSTNDVNLMSCLFKLYATTEDILTNCAIAHLLKNDCKVSETEEDPVEFAHRIHSKQNAIEELKAQLNARLPKVRDLTGAEFLETLEIATYQISENVIQAREWDAKLQSKSSLLPYPIIYGSSTDPRWENTTKGKISVTFNGIDKYLKDADPVIKEWFKVNKGYPFQIKCDQRQLSFFKRFLKDWQDFKANEDTYPEGLFTLRSAMLTWRKCDGKGDPWTVNHLSLQCTFDTRLMTAEGTLAVQQEKSDKAVKNLENENADPRNQSTLDRLKNLPDRPSKKPYKGNPEILVGLSIGLANPVTVAVVNVRTGDVLTYRTPKTLLGKQYRLLNRHRTKQQQNILQRQKNQKLGIAYQPSESELGEYVDRLLANEIVKLAQQYRADSIVIPTLTHIRTVLASEITARAEQKCPGSVEAQKKYAKDYQMTISRWSYNRLIETIRSKAQQLGVAVESGFQPARASPQEQAKDIAIATYHSRQNSTE